MNWKTALLTAVIVMCFIYVFKWINSQYELPVVGQIIKSV